MAFKSLFRRVTGFAQWGPTRKAKLSTLAKLAVLATVVWLGLVLLFTRQNHIEAYLAIPSSDEPPNGQPVLQLLLIGDAGKATQDSPLLHAAARRVNPSAESLVVYLGDNLYEAGLSAEDATGRLTDERILLTQIDAFRKTPARIIFVPGNHDWDNSKAEGHAKILRQAEFVTKHGDGKVELLPQGGLPGPVCRDHAGVRLVFFDSQWWLHKYAKPDDSLPAIAQRLRDCLAASQPQPRHSVFVSHHPPESHGVHGGFFSWQEHLFPLTRLHGSAYLPVPILGSAYPLVRGLGVSRQDLANAHNRALIESLRHAMNQHPPLVWAAGHEHSLQVFGEPTHGGSAAGYVLVSGSGSKLNPVTHGERTLYAHQAPGFMELLFFADGRVLLEVHAETEGSLKSTFRHWISAPTRP